MSNKLNDHCFGPIQRQWLENLEQYPERQCVERLGGMTKDGYEACCLGELLITSYRANGDSILNVLDSDGQIWDGGVAGVLANSFNELGLHGNAGEFASGSIKFDEDESYGSLAELNDGGYTWPEIAQWIRENPDEVIAEKV